MKGESTAIRENDTILDNLPLREIEITKNSSSKSKREKTSRDECWWSGWTAIYPNKQVETTKHALPPTWPFLSRRAAEAPNLILSGGSVSNPRRGGTRDKRPRYSSVGFTPRHPLHLPHLPPFLLLKHVVASVIFIIYQDGFFSSRLSFLYMTTTPHT